MSILIASATSVKTFIDFEKKGLKPLVCPKHNGDRYRSTFEESYQG